MTGDNKTTIAIFRCVIGNYDIVLRERIIIKDADYFLFTDRPDLNIYPYKTIHVNVIDHSPSLTNRNVKIKIPKILRDYDLTIYLDCNIAVLCDLSPLVAEFLSSEKEMGSLSHPYFKSMNDEINSCIKAEQASESVLREEIKFYNSLPDIPRARLSDNSILFRRKPSKKMLNAMNYWYELVKRFSGRDQISLPSVKATFNIDDYFFNFSPRSSGNQYFLVFPHRPSSKNRFSFKSITFMARCAFKLCIRELILLRNMFGKLNV